ncbi:DUF207 domain-containing protein [Phialemonium atrogriseum]|uniref:tRNA(Phe) 7-[(3-amino-3-carboxypropyl)-4-demethylwyosine(37)-N(4)]-methyltransferase n=1 Tax=Phialemonium atrogriseum TaxID=1093897 RepID=A0AAJ0C2C6_9PEZI|nr:DUF207 domain-containing protein [Phialemonium atrogriseum]KAK1768864.1 DUF207 domain-containing protein [Phialemonium atrogriseum]
MHVIPFPSNCDDITPFPTMPPPRFQQEYKAAMKPLPSPHPGFTRKKAKILEQLSVPASEYTDSSPKGSVDEGIRELIDGINSHDGLVTTSSCAGRVSVFVEGRKGVVAAPEEADQPSSVKAARLRPDKPASTAGGKGGGGSWLFVSHDPVDLGGCDDPGGRDVAGLFGLEIPADQARGLEDAGQAPLRLIHFKFEPMILHILTASPSHAQLVLKCGLQAGYRESGAINLLEGKLDAENANPMVAIRSMGLSLESLIGVESDGRRRCIVSLEYLKMLVQIANERFGENEKRIERFWTALQAALDGQKAESREEPRLERDVRRETKKAEGLRRQEELGKERQRPPDEAEILLEPNFF